ncbi:ndufa6 NADH-ubiquinone oxidoreductase subunit [Cladophialophora chaetospira]|uniref:Ndufa6 NADH-ubiquinone oxidoreductase subunit n=1 Tax=Cladophialophora chaetospira TaxID=386627 RepID=A0AA38XFH3_9EURO|nr:ndufa6 NADH-ubiquinone oxidoreductase subunit [Cladophialophora chaetospira]
MVINPTFLAQRSRTSLNWGDARRRVLKSYREWLRAGPEIQQMYSLNMPISRIRTKVREEFEKHRYVNNIQAVDVLLQQNQAEFQETLNYWKQSTHVMKYFRADEDELAKLPKNFISGFLEVRIASSSMALGSSRNGLTGTSSAFAGTKLMAIRLGTH